VIIDILLGSKSERIYRASSTRGRIWLFQDPAGPSCPQSWTSSRTRVSGSDRTTYPVLALTERSRGILHDDEPVFIMVTKVKPKQSKFKRTTIRFEPETGTLLDRICFLA
jgi:hypothetical protein